MYWLDVDLVSNTTTLHTGECVRIEPKPKESKGVNEMRVDGGWFSFDTIGEAMRFTKVTKLSGDVASCLLCRPLDHLSDVSMARLDVMTPRTGCDAAVKEVEVLDTKSNYRRLLSRLLGER